MKPHFATVSRSAPLLAAALLPTFRATHGEVGALGVGLIESFGSFWASAFKEVIVFSSILPVLLWRSLRDPHGEEH